MNDTMLSKEVLGTIIADQLTGIENFKYSVPRTAFEKAVTYSGTSALFVMGIRRCGKSTMLKQLIKEKFQGEFYYCNFDDERLIGFKVEDFQTLMEVFSEKLGQKKNAFFDEIQNITGWELFVTRLIENGYRVFITGSNANLLSKKLATHMTGRHVELELYPFSFTEFLVAQKTEIQKQGFYSTEEKATLSKKFKEYMTKGGMPEAIVSSNEEILTQVLSDIIQKDIVARHNIRKISELRAVLNFLIANAGNPITYTSIKNNFKEIKTVNTVQKYMEYAEETYLIFTVKRFEKKAKQFDKNDKKIYCGDNGIITKNTPVTLERNAGLLENSVALHLKRLGKEFYYYKGKTDREVDFIIPKESQAIQVCYELNEKNNKREIDGLREAMRELKTPNGLILTMDQEQEIKHEEGTITVKPAWQWMMEKISHPEFEEIEQLKGDIERAIQKPNARSLETIIATVYDKSLQKDLFQNKSFRETIFKILEAKQLFTPSLANRLLQLLFVQLNKVKEIKEDLAKHKEALLYWVKPKGLNYYAKAMGLRLMVIAGDIDGFKQLILDGDSKEISEMHHALNLAEIKNRISKEDIIALRKWVSEEMEKPHDDMYVQRFHDLYSQLNR